MDTPGPKYKKPHLTLEKRAPLEESYPPLESPASYASLLKSPKPPANMMEMLLEPYNYVAEVPGKGVRKLLAKAFNHWLDVEDEKLSEVNEIVRMLHNASLIIDDVEDESEMRRGIPCAHRLYGLAQTLNSGNLVYFLAMERVAALGHPDALATCLEEMLQLHRGQGLELAWRDRVHCPTAEEYSRMVLDKTGGLFRMAVKLLQLFSDNKDIDLMPLVNRLALSFQINDDLISLTDADYMEKKGFLEDITEGKMSFPIIHAIRADPHDTRLIGILRQKTSDPEIKRYAVSYMESTGSFEYTRSVLRANRVAILEEIASLGGNPVLEKIVEKFFSKGLDSIHEPNEAHDESGADDKAGAEAGAEAGSSTATE